ncbi:MAG: hypothetical protein H7Z73_12495, partial [Candidatus Saccharibacteria bacterium]|nr:hypothetical protein [Moraxellaceae bacterium]
MNSSSSWRHRFYPVIWLLSGVSVLLASAILWIWLQLADRVIKIHSFDDSGPKSAASNRFPMDLGNLSNIVPVLDLTKMAAKQDSTHSAEFKAAAFIAQHQNDWTLQLMNVSQESVITDFLAKRSDRARFQYFRYNKGGRDESFILTYNVFTTVQTAMGAMQTMDFGLPASVKAFPERFSTYKPFVSDSDERVSDSIAAQRQVNLRAVAMPPPTDVIEEKLAQIAATTIALPATVKVADGFSGEPDALPTESAIPNASGVKTR